MVQVASCTNQMGQIAIVAMQNSSPKVTECFNVESRILCMAYVPAEQREENGENVPDDNQVSSAKASDAPSVCLGMEEGRCRRLQSELTKKCPRIASWNMIIHIMLSFLASLCTRAASGLRRCVYSISSPQTSPLSPAWCTGSSAYTLGWSAAPWQSTPDQKVCVSPVLGRDFSNYVKLCSLILLSSCKWIW